MTTQVNRTCLLILGAWFSAIMGTPSALAQSDRQPVARYYFADVSVYSLVPGKGIAAIEGQFVGGGFGPGGTFGTSIMQGKREIALLFDGQLRDGRFICNMSASEVKGEARVELPQLAKQIDLTDLDASTIEIAKDADGRRYVVRIVPKVVEPPTAIKFDPTTLRLTYFSFDASPVILDDQEYLGTIQMASGEFVTFDITSIAKIEFSLVPFKGASERGFLKDGQIKIQHEGHSLMIQRVLNGSQSTVLQGGPYKLYVRWSPPTYTHEEAKKLMREQLAELKAQAAKGLGTQSPESLRVIEAQMEKQLEQRKHYLTYGLGPISAEDRE